MKVTVWQEYLFWVTELYTSCSVLRKIGLYYSREMSGSLSIVAFWPVSCGTNSPHVSHKNIHQRWLQTERQTQLKVQTSSKLLWISNTTIKCTSARAAFSQALPHADRFSDSVLFYLLEGKPLLLREWPPLAEGRPGLRRNSLSMFFKNVYDHLKSVS